MLFILIHGNKQFFALFFDAFGLKQKKIQNIGYEKNAEN